jgi:hypothetical protein
MSTASSLSDRSKKDLAGLARKKGIRGSDAMSKPELLKALAKLQKVKPAAKPAPARVKAPAPKPVAKSAAKLTRPAKPAAVPKPVPKPTANGTATRTLPHPVAKPAVPSPAAKINTAPRPAMVPPVPAAKAPAKPAVPTARPAVPAKPAPPAPKPYVPPPPPPPISREKDLSTAKPGGGVVSKDRIFLMVPDPYWLHATWELTHQSVHRAEAALRQDWHGAKPIIRLFDVTSNDTTSTSETPVRDINVVGGCNNWYIDVSQPPRSYRADIGYVSRRGEFYVLARSNVVTPPKAGSTEALDVGWAEMDTKKAERIMAMSSGFESPSHPELRELFEERLRRPMGAPKETGFGTGAVPPASIKKFFFEIDAELIVYGKTDPTAHVTLQNEPVKLRPDGTFTMLFSLPDSRQIIPAVATSSDGVEERTIVLAVERNTKHLDPMIHDQMNEQQ